MAKLYGKGTITELVKGKKYRIALSAGKDPLSGRVYQSSDDVPDNAYAINDDGKAIKPRVVWGKAADEQKALYGRWQTPVEYLRHQETFLGTKRQAQLRIEEIRRELEHGKAPNADKVTFAEWCEKYLTMREGLGKYRPATLKADRSRSKHLVNGLGAVRVADITPSVINDLYLALRADGVGDTCILQAHKLLKRIMAYAVDNDIITRNPCDKVQTPRKPKPKREALSASEASRLGAICAEGTPTANETAVYLGLALGARLGEVLGLTWGHVVLDGPRPFAHIMQQHTAEGKRAPLKTDADDNPVGRIVPLDGSTVAVLKAWRSVQREQLNTIGVEQGSDTPIITNGLGDFTDHANFQRWWRSFCVKHGFGRIVDSDGREIVELRVGDDASLYPDSEFAVDWRDSDGWPCDESGKRYSRSYKRPKAERRYDGLNFHELRHTHFTMRLAAGMDIPTAQALGGWSTPTVLMNVYAHPTPENVWASAGFMDGLTVKQFA